MEKPELEKIAGLANPAATVELVNFNPLAMNKYALMDRSTEFFQGMAPLPEEEIKPLRKALESEGLFVAREHKRPEAA